MLTVRRLTARDYMALAGKVKAEPDLAYAYWIAATVIDGDGKRIFTDEDAAVLADADHAIVNRLAETAIRLNGAAPGQAPKNSQTPPVDSSTP